MSIHKSSVNFQNLIRDLAEMYPFDIADVIVVELIANSLDAKATHIFLNYDLQKKVLVIQDDGKGMDEVQFDKYHDFAAGLKARGVGIGFAGLGAKVSFNIADRVITETKNKSVCKGSNWYLKSKKELIWEDIKPKHIEEKGTRVEIHFRSNVRTSYEETEGLINILHRHYLPLLDLKFLDLYERMGVYSSQLRFIVNNCPIKPGHLVKDFSLKQVNEFFPKRRNKLFGYGIFGIADSEYPIAADICGVLLCTYGKVIKVDLFNQFPGSLGPQIFGLVEIPEFINYLTTSKTDFMRKGRFRQFEKLYDPIRQEFKAWLGRIGVKSVEIIESDEAIELEREIRKIVEDIPELSEFFGFRSRKNIFMKDEKGSIPATTQEGVEITFPIGEGEKGDALGALDIGEDEGLATYRNEQGKEKAKPISRKARRGPKISFVNASDRIELSWIEGNNVVINTGHPSYKKAQFNSRARRFHNLFSIASAVQKFLARESEKPDFMFIDRMMAAWGNK